MVSILLAGCSAPKETASYRQISMDEAITMMEAESGYIILDVRTRSEFADKHIPGSQNVPLQQLDKVEEITENKDTVLYAYCYSGARSR